MVKSVYPGSIVIEAPIASSCYKGSLTGHCSCHPEPCPDENQNCFRSHNLQVQMPACRSRLKRVQHDKEGIYDCISSSGPYC